MDSRFGRLLAASLVVALLAGPAAATWSIIIVDLRTGEVSVGSCTCLTSFDLRTAVPVVVVGRGAAAAQSFVDGSGQNRALIRTRLLQGVDPALILAQLAAQDPGHQTRQYGIVDVAGRALTFTGTGAFAWAGGVTGRIGNDLVYAIQGNILTGQPVVLAAEQALLNTPGDMAAKLMAGMQAARAMGGDGRCSCSQSTPTACGAPPPAPFKSSHIGCMIVARPGDQDGPCNATVGCASGTYYLNFNVAFQNATDPDPVIQLQAQYDAFRQTWLNRPDHFRSSVSIANPVLNAGGTSTTTAFVTLRNWQGAPISGSGVTLSATVDPGAVSVASVGPATPLGGGTYSFPITAGTTPGIAQIRVRAVFPGGSVLLSPLPSVAVVSQGLYTATTQFSAAAGGTIAFQLAAGAAHAWRPYVLALSASGTQPGLTLSPGFVLPLNPDSIFSLGLALLDTPFLPGASGQLSGSGAATASFVAPSGLLAPLAGQALAFAFATLDPFDYVSNPRLVAIVP